MVKFDSMVDREKVICGGPWILFDHYLAVKEWSPEFNPSEECFGQTMVWVRLFGLNLLYYHAHALKVIAAGIGRLVRVDLVTDQVGRGKYAWICMEVNLNLPIVQKVWIQDHWHSVEVESLHMICSECQRDCPNAKKEESTVGRAVAEKTIGIPQQSAVGKDPAKEISNSNLNQQVENHGGKGLILEREINDWVEVKNKKVSWQDKGKSMQGSSISQ